MNLEAAFRKLKSDLSQKDVRINRSRSTYLISGNNRSIELEIPDDILISSHEKIRAMILSKLKLNSTVFARSCVIRTISPNVSEDFINRYHLMNATGSAFRYGLFLKEELLSVAVFSKGRRMNRLPENKRSYELIRFCTKEGITVTGGLSKLVKYFCREKQAGDVMTYIDKQLANTESFLSAGFKFHSESGKLKYLINQKDMKRMLQKEETLNESDVVVEGPGRVKLVFTCND